jgi:hypothetical protein
LILKKTKITVVYTHEEKDIGTLFYDLKGLSNWQLEHLWRLLKAEDARARIINGFNRGIPELSKALDELAKTQKWRIDKEPKIELF